MAKPTMEDLQRQNALLSSSLRELLRIAREAENDPTCAAPEVALDGALLQQWRLASKRAAKLLQVVP
jgi:hypothetical protein